MKIFLVYRSRYSYVGIGVNNKCFTCIAFNSVITKKPEKLGGKIDCGGGQSAVFASFPYCVVDIKKPRRKQWLDGACSLDACGINFLIWTNLGSTCRMCWEPIKRRRGRVAKLFFLPGLGRVWGRCGLENPRVDQ